MVFIARQSPSGAELRLIRAGHRTFTGSAGFLDDPADPQARERIGEYLTDMAAAYGRELSSDLAGQSYGEMAETLIDSMVSPDEPVDLLILAFSVHDVRPGRQTAAYLSHVTPGAPMAFSVCDQGSAAAFTGLRLAREYAASAGVRRALLVVVEQATLPYDCPVPLPSQHQGVALLFDASSVAQAKIMGVYQHPGIAPDDVAARAAADLAALVPGYAEVHLVLSDSLAAQWNPLADLVAVRVMPPGQPSTGVWRGLADELAALADEVAGLAGERLLVVADYDPGLRYLCLTAFDTCVGAAGSKAASTATSSTARSTAST